METLNTKLLEKLYNDPKKGFRGVSNLLAAARKVDRRITRKEVVAYLHTNNAYTRHFPKARHIQHNPWVATGPDSHHMADLAMLPTLKRYNKGFCYILVVVDVFSRYVFARPLKNKECSTVTTAYEDILHSSWRIPARLYTDKGKSILKTIEICYFYFRYRIYGENISKICSITRNLPHEPEKYKCEGMLC